MTTLLVEGQQLTMEIDTGAAVSLVSEETIKTSHLKDFPLSIISVTQYDYKNTMINPKYIANPKVQYNYSNTVALSLSTLTMSFPIKY